jgi:hypothetical protein
MEQTFPIPKSGVTIRKTGLDSFDIECIDTDTADYHRLLGFFEQMLGGFRSFRFEHAGVIHPKCCFDSDSVGFHYHRT